MDGFDDFFYFPWHGAAVGVTQNQTVCTSFGGYLDSLECIFGIVFVAIEEMFSIINYFFAKQAAKLALEYKMKDYDDGTATDVDTTTLQAQVQF